MINGSEFGFSLQYDASIIQRDSSVPEGKSRLCVEEIGMHPHLRWYTHGEWKIAILGNPIVRSRRDDSVIKSFANAQNLKVFSRMLNGSFLVMLFHNKAQRLHIINDRFASLALYYSMDLNIFRASMFLSDLISMRQKSGLSAHYEPAAIFEFVSMRRLFGEHTYESNCEYLSSASIITLSPGYNEPQVEKYWQADFSKRAPRGGALVDAIKDGLKNTLTMHMSDSSERHYGIFLSGGLDARAILAASNSENPLTCFTTCIYKNNEFFVAAEVAAAAGCTHHYIPRPVDLYDGKLDTAVRLSSGMHSFVECQFLDYDRFVPDSIDTMMTGLALDVFLSGLYLPKQPVTILGRQALHYRLKPISSDFIDDFIHGVSYRMKTFDPFMLLRKDVRVEMQEQLRESLDVIACRGKALGAKGYDLWEYMHHHNFSRHYSFPMMTSVRTWADCRSPGLENNLFDLAISMTADQKVNGTPYIRAVSLLNKELMKVRNANTNLPAHMPLHLQSGYKAVLMLGNRLFGTKYPQSPGWQDRSWPKVSVSMAASNEIQNAQHDLPNLHELEALDIFDMKTIRRIVDEHKTGYADHGATIVVLLTVARFLSISSFSENKYVPCQYDKGQM